MIELMVVVAILALAASYGMYFYRDYVIRSSIGALVPVASGAKADIESEHNEGTVFGVTSETLITTGETDKPFALDSMSRTSYGCIELDIDLAQLQLNGSDTLIMAWCPSTDAGSIIWRCGYNASSTVEMVDYLPNECQSTQVSIQDNSF